MVARVNRQILLKSQPEGAPSLDNFALKQGSVPEPGDGEVLMRTRWLSVEVGATMVGGTVGEVVASRNSNFAVGDIVMGYGGWQDYALPPRLVTSTVFSASAQPPMRAFGVGSGAPNRPPTGPSADPADPIKACGRSGEEVGPFCRAGAFREQLAGVPVDRVAEAFLVRREVAFKH